MSHFKRRFVITLLSLMLAGFALAGPAWAESDDYYLGVAGPGFDLPKNITIVGERVPLEISQVYERLDREFTIAVLDKPQVYMWLKRAGRFFPHIEKALAEAGLPDDLKYLALAESSFITDISSPKHALGTWQFLARTGRSYGLRKNKTIDERLHFEKSTQAAIKFLKRLYDVFGKWTLAMAAYNCGRARLKSEIQEQQLSNYWRLRLPKETERYIFRILAVKIIMENPQKYGFTLPPGRVYKPISYDLVSIRTYVPIHFTPAAKALGTDYRTLKKLNPQYKGRYIPAGKLTLAVPKGKTDRFRQYLDTIGATSPKPKRKKAAKTGYYVVKEGDTLSEIAEKQGVPLMILKKLNKLRNSKIIVGQKLRLTP